jgi:5-methylcytosine-specific restriction endonuclease McrA
MSRNWSAGSTRAWRRTRARVLDRDGHQCQLRIEGICTGRATHVHHTHGRAITGDDPAHLVAACPDCNLHLGDPTTQPDPQPRPRTPW